MWRAAAPVHGQYCMDKPDMVLGFLVHIHTRTLPSITATQLLVVPRSMPMTSSARRELDVLRALTDHGTF